MNERAIELYKEAAAFAYENIGKEHVDTAYFKGTIAGKFAELIVKECAKELREAEQEADRAYKAKEVKERNTFNGYDFADMLEERFGVE